jgi:hypothetical protein
MNKFIPQSQPLEHHDAFLNLRAETIDDVIQSLDKIIEWSKSHKSRLGYFAALYRKVTIKVRDGIKDVVFDDGERMERLDVIFANRYLEAFEQYQNSTEPSLSWHLAFDASKKWRPIVLQHLLLGMNAHIDLDLGIAAAEMTDSESFPELKNDFYKINDILVSLINEVQAELAAVWPLLKLLDKIAGEADEGLAKFGMKYTRGRAWKAAEELSGLSPEAQAVKKKILDQNVADIGNKIVYPGWVIRLLLFLVRIGEMRSVTRIIQILE